MTVSYIGYHGLEELLSIFTAKTREYKTIDDITRVTEYPGNMNETTYSLLPTEAT